MFIIQPSPSSRLFSKIFLAFGMFYFVLVKIDGHKLIGKSDLVKINPFLLKIYNLSSMVLQ